ncbi:putative reverse transcriptase domain-containing protein [Tanacetum coccineum]
MAAPIISISSDASDESVGSAPSRIILFGTISAEIPTKTPVISPVAPRVETTIVTPPTGLRDLIPYSDFDSDSPDGMISPEYISPLPATSPFICTDSLETSTSRPSPSAGFPIVAPPGFRRPPAILIRLRQAIPFGRPYRSLSDASPAHASGDATPDQSLSGYSSPATTIDDSPASPRFVYPPIMTLRYSEAYRRWRSAALSTMCPPTISESSFKDLSSESYAGSSRKRCRSPTVTMPLHISALGALVPTRADLILPRKRFRDSYLSEESIEEDIDDGVGIEFDTGIGMGVEVAREDRIGDIEIDSLPLHTSLTLEELRQARRTRYYDRTMTNTHSVMTPATIEEMINRRLAEALEAHEANRNLGLGNGNDEGGNGNGGNGNGNHNKIDRGARPDVRECTYQDVMKCQPLNFHRTEGVFGLIRWFEKMETMFHISNYLEKYQDRAEKLIGGLPDNIQGNVMAVEPTRLHDAVHHRGQQPPFKRQNVRGQNVARACTVGNNERKVYAGFSPLYKKCKFHHEGACTVRCGKCNKCGRQGHYKSDCPELKNQDRRNKTGNKSRNVGEAKGKAYILRGGDADPNSNTVMGTFFLNNHYASMFFDSGADRSFMSTTFSALLDVIPSTLGISYAVELADGRIAETNTVLRGCTLRLLGHPFNMDLMPVELGSFDFIIGMHWLENLHAVIVCDEKIVRIPYGDEVLIVQGNRSGEGNKSKLSIISCIKTQKYIKKGCQVFLAQVTKK